MEMPVQSKEGDGVFSSFSEEESGFLAGKTTLRCGQSQARRGLQAHLLKCVAAFFAVCTSVFVRKCHDHPSFFLHL
jgi:hypothetical protein